MQKAKNILVSAQNNMSSCHQFIFIVWQCNTMPYVNSVCQRGDNMTLLHNNNTDILRLAK